MFTTDYSLNLPCETEPKDSLDIYYNGGNLFLLEISDGRVVEGSVNLSKENAIKLRGFLIAKTK